MKRGLGRLGVFPFFPQPLAWQSSPMNNLRSPPVGSPLTSTQHEAFRSSEFFPSILCISNDFVVTIAYEIIPRLLGVHFTHWNSWSWYLAQRSITRRSNLGELLIIMADTISNFMSQNNWPRLLNILHQSLFHNVKCILHGCLCWSGLRICLYQGI